MIKKIKAKFWEMARDWGIPIGIWAILVWILVWIFLIFINIHEKEIYEKRMLTLKVNGQVWMVGDLSYVWTKAVQKLPFCITFGQLLDSRYTPQKCENKLKRSVVADRWKNMLNACPIGWHLPSLSEFRTALEYGEDDIAHDRRNDCEIVGEKNNAIFWIGEKISPLTAYCDIPTSRRRIITGSSPLASLDYAFIVRCIKD